MAVKDWCRLGEPGQGSGRRSWAGVSRSGAGWTAVTERRGLPRFGKHGQAVDVRRARVGKGSVWLGWAVGASSGSLWRGQ